MSPAEAAHPNVAAVLLLLLARHQPWLMHALRRHARQLRHPCAAVVALQVVVLLQTQQAEATIRA